MGSVTSRTEWEELTRFRCENVEFTAFTPPEPRIAGGACCKKLRILTIVMTYTDPMDLAHTERIIIYDIYLCACRLKVVTE